MVDDIIRQQAYAYCRIDRDSMPFSEQSLFDSLLDAQVAYLEQAGVRDSSSGEEHYRYGLLVCAMMLDAWDRRGTTVEGASVYDNPAFRRMLNQAKLASQGGVL